MSASPAFLRQFNVPSGIVSGLAALIFDIILLSLIKAQTQYLCSIANLYQIYDRRNCISPTTSRLGCLTGSPVGHPTLARYFSLLIAATTAAVIVLGFSINGKSVKTFQTIAYTSAVVLTTVPLHIDYNREFVQTPIPGKPDRRAVSTRLAAVFDLYTCAQNNFTHSTQYSYAYRNLRLDHSMVSLGNRLSGAECITKPRFKTDHVLRQGPMPDAARVIQCEFRDLTFSIHGDALTGQATFSSSSNCVVNVPRLQCFRKQGTSCAGVGTIKRDAGNKDYLVIIQNTLKPNITSSAEIPRMESAHHERLATNAAFFSRILRDADAYYIALVLFSAVKYDISLSRSTGTREISEIDMRYAAPILVFVSFIVALLAIAVIISWQSVVYSKNRGKYNTFSTVPEILALAGYGAKSKMRCRNGDYRFIGVHSELPALHVMSAEECNNAAWAEDDIR